MAKTGWFMVSTLKLVEGLSCSGGKILSKPKLGTSTEPSQSPFQYPDITEILLKGVQNCYIIHSNLSYALAHIRSDIDMLVKLANNKWLTTALI